MTFLLFPLIGWANFSRKFLISICSLLSCSGLMSSIIVSSRPNISWSFNRSRFHERQSMSANATLVFLPPISTSSSPSSSSIFSSCCTSKRTSWRVVTKVSIASMVSSIISFIRLSVRRKLLTEDSKRFSRLIAISFFSPFSRPDIPRCPPLSSVSISYLARFEGRI